MIQGEMLSVSSNESGKMWQTHALAESHISGGYMIYAYILVHNETAGRILMGSKWLAQN